MKKEPLLSPHELDRYNRSADFLQNHTVVFVSQHEIPDPLLVSWLECDPVGVLMKFADQTAEPGQIFTYAIYLYAYELHDRCYHQILGESYRTPPEIVMLNFLRYQKLLRYTAFLRNRRIETPPFQILHFMNYLTIYPMMRKYAHGYMNDKQRNGD